MNILEFKYIDFSAKRISHTAMKQYRNFRIIQFFPLQEKKLIPKVSVSVDDVYKESNKLVKRDSSECLHSFKDVRRES